MILARLVLYLALGAPLGLTLLAWQNAHVAAAIGIRRWLVGATIVALGASLAWLALVSAQMAGVPTWPVDAAGVGIVLGETSVGTAWMVRMAALVVAGAAATIVHRRTAALAAHGLAIGVALATLAWSGHGAVDDGAVGWLHLAADVLHLLAGGAWLGALVGLTVLLTRRGLADDVALLRATHHALHGFARMGTLVVGLLVMTGVVQGWLLVGPGNVVTLPSIPYGRLLLAKLALFGGMLALAGLNRFRFAPRLQIDIGLGDPSAIVRALRRSLACETLLAVGVFALVAWLGTLEPPAAIS